MYSEQVGSKRHDAGSIGDTNRLYPLNSRRTKAFMFPLRGFPEERARPHASTVAAAGPACADARRRREKLISQLGVAGSRGPALCIDNEIKVRRDSGGGPSKDFPKQTLHAVSNYSAADLARNCDAKAMMSHGVRLGK